ncbi:MAG TPA: YafY family protein [Herpetosiphonaceae bacterium]
MNRTDRLLAIVLELQAHGRRRAEDLAATFEVSKRTIYRDIQALCEAGVPVVAEPGLGYALPAGYFLPPLRFTTDEAVMLLLGADVMARSFDAEYQAAARDAARKISGALAEPLRGEVGALRASIRFIPPLGDSGQDDALRLARRAIIGRRRLRFAYQARYREEPAWREVDPYGLVHHAGNWYLAGHCHLRGALRLFRFSRMDGLAALPASFERPADFAMERDPGGGRDLEIRALIVGADPAELRESPLFFLERAERQADGMLVTLLARHERDVLPWLLGWGGRARVLEPAALRRRMAAEAAALLANHQDPEDPDSLLT